MRKGLEAAFQLLENRLAEYRIQQKDCEGNPELWKQYAERQIAIIECQLLILHAMKDTE